MHEFVAVACNAISVVKIIIVHSFVQKHETAHVYFITSTENVKKKPKISEQTNAVRIDPDAVGHIRPEELQMTMQS